MSKGKINFLPLFIASISLKLHCPGSSTDRTTVFGTVSGGSIPSQGK